MHTSPRQIPIWLEIETLPRKHHHLLIRFRPWRLNNDNVKFYLTESKLTKDFHFPGASALRFDNHIWSKQVKDNNDEIAEMTLVDERGNGALYIVWPLATAHDGMGLERLETNLLPVLASLEATLIAGGISGPYHAHIDIRGLLGASPNIKQFFKHDGYILVDDHQPRLTDFAQPVIETIREIATGRSIRRNQVDG